MTGRKHYVTYRREVRLPHSDARRPIATHALSELEDLRPQPCDEIRLMEGAFWPPIAAVDATTLSVTPKPVTLRNVCGAAERPILIRGSGQKTRIVGANAATPVYPDLPEARHFAFFRLIDCAWIEIADMAVESCWPCFVYLENCQNITVRGITARDGVYLVFARGPGCRRILVEDCALRQDPTRVMWQDLDWNELHHGGYAFYNGGLFGAEDIVGEVVIRNNIVEDAFNAVRIVGAEGRSGYDVEIHGNVFRRIRDNAVEPERFAENWLIHDNLIDDAHAWFSFDGVVGGWRHVLGNRGTFRSQPGRSHLSNRGGRVLKYDENAVAGDPEKPSIVAHNSWNTRSFVAKCSVVRGLRHQANLIVFCQATSPDNELCPERGTMTRDFADIETWPPDVTFDWDETTLSFGVGIEMPEPNEENGAEDSDIRFRDPASDDFGPSRPAISVPLLTLHADVDWPASETWCDWRANPTAGLVSGDGVKFEAPPFHASAMAVGPPRIVRVSRSTAECALLWLSAPPDTEGLWAEARNGQGRWISLHLTSEKREVRLSTRDNVDLRSSAIRIFVTRTSPSVTGWACPDPSIEVLPV